MAIKKIRFPLEMDNGAEARTLDELRGHFSMEKVVLYYSDGKLLKWLRNNYLDEEAEAISELDPKDPELNRKLCGIFDVEYNESAKVDIEKLTANKQRLSRLKEYTADEKFADVIDRVAFDQNELEELLNNGAGEVYLCGSWFRIPLDRENVCYIGINQPIAEINSAEMVDFKAKNISFENLKFNREYVTAVSAAKLDADFSGSAWDWIEAPLRKCKICSHEDEDNKKIIEKYTKMGYLHYSMYLADYRFGERYENNEYKYIAVDDYLYRMFGDIHRRAFRNVITIISDNMKYMYPYLDMSKHGLSLIKKLDSDQAEPDTAASIIKYSGLVIFNFINDELTYHYYAGRIGLLIPEKYKQKIENLGIPKSFVEKYICEKYKCNGFLLPFDIIKDILLDKETVMIYESHIPTKYVEHENRAMFLYRDEITNNPWFISSDIMKEFDVSQLMEPFDSNKISDGKFKKEKIKIDNAVLCCPNCGGDLSVNFNKCYCSRCYTCSPIEKILEYTSMNTKNVENHVEKPKIGEVLVEDVVKHDSEADYEECYKGFCPVCGKYIEIDESESMIDDDGCVECPNCEEIINVDDIWNEFAGNCPECGEYIEFDSNEIDDDDGVYCPECGETFDIEDFVAENYDDDD